ncbi:unnamed protein product, partial [Callosobruchus maculatus]
YVSESAVVVTPQLASDIYIVLQCGAVQRFGFSLKAGKISLG